VTAADEFLVHHCYVGGGAAECDRAETKKGDGDIS
jgi:hypothetical protein